MRKFFRYFFVAPFFGCVPGEETGEPAAEEPVKKQSSGGKFLADSEEKSPRHENRFQKWGLTFYWIFAMLYWETLVHASMYDSFRGNFRFALGFTAGLALLIGLLVGLLPGRSVFPVSIVLSAVLIFVYGSQMVYCFIFGTPYSVSQIGLGADAVSQFWREMFTTMGDNIFWILGLLAPLALLVLLHGMNCLKNPGWIRRGVVLALTVGLPLITYAGICRGGTAMFSDYYFFTSTKSTTAQTLERFGVPMTFFLETTQIEEPEDTQSAQIGTDLPLVVVTQPTVPVETEPEAVPPTYNILDIDFDALSQSTENEKLIALNNYCSQLPGTKQNEYTGMLKDYNLILICAESFSPAAVDPEITPTLYKLTTEGFVFNNFYNSYPNTTIDGEYTLTQGLYPDASRGKDNSSMVASSENLLPFALGNIFAEQRGIKSWGYHNNIGSYYQRYLSHPNMGYEMQFNHSGMEMTGYWPTSDLEMMEQSVDDYISQDQFNVYYMTFSGHYLYKTSQNLIAAKNYDLVKDLPLSCEEEKAYLSCHIELDKAMEYLLQRLEEEGIADRTAIVMVADHIPYGLLKWQYYELLGQEEDLFGRYKSNLVFWVGGMETPVEVDTYCCNADVLPTILNLWGFDYDSRLLPGTDIFSDSPHTAVLIDHSFLNDQVWFDTNTGEVRYLVDASEVPEGYVDAMNQQIAAQFDFSAQVLRNDYYRFIFGE